MTSYIDLKTLAPLEVINQVMALEQKLPHVSTVQIRHEKIHALTQSKRQLWQAYGMEHIEPELLTYIDSLPKGSVFYDIGASTGLFSLYAASRGLTVWAFEPDAQNYALLEYNNYLNSNHMKGTLNSLNLALSSHSHLATLNIAHYEAAGHMKILNKAIKVQESESFEPVHQQKVMAYALDDLLLNLQLPEPEYLKIDVDGSELAVINGAKKTLQSPTLRSIFIELDELSEQTPSVIAQIEHAGFTLSERTQVQHYANLYNCLFLRT